MRRIKIISYANRIKQHLYDDYAYGSFHHFHRYRYFHRSRLQKKRAGRNEEA